MTRTNLGANDSDKSWVYMMQTMDDAELILAQQEMLEKVQLLLAQQRAELEAQFQAQIEARVEVRLREREARLREREARLREREEMRSETISVCLDPAAARGGAANWGADIAGPSNWAAWGADIAGPSNWAALKTPSVVSGSVRSCSPSSSLCTSGPPISR